MANLMSSPILESIDILYSPDFRPEFTFQILVASYVLVGTLSVYVWEILNNILNDYKLLFEHRIRLPTVVYFISRASCLGFIVSITVFVLAPLHTCNGLETTLHVFFSVTIASTTLLSFFRTRAIFDKNPWIIAFFAGLWLAILTGCLTFIVGVGTVHIRPKIFSGCRMNGYTKPFAAVATIIPLINDTLVFLAITWRLCCNSYACRTLKNGFRVLVFGDYLPVVSKAMLQDGQAYYLTTITFNLVTVIMMFNRSIPNVQVLRIIFTIPNVALMNIMACRVFRNTKLGYFMETQISTNIISREVEPVISLSLWERGPGSRTKQTGGNVTPNIDGITITRTVERA